MKNVFQTPKSWLKVFENSAAIEFCRTLVKKDEPERYFISLFGPKDAQGSLWSIFAFNSELSRIKNSVTEPMIGRIRLQWWRESLEKLQENNGGGHYILQALQTLLLQNVIQLSDLMSLVDAREIEFEETSNRNIEEILKYTESTHGLLTELSAKISSCRSDDINWARKIGTSWGLIEIAANKNAKFNTTNFNKTGISNSTGLDENPVLKTEEILTHASNSLEGFRPNFRDQKSRVFNLMLPNIKSDIASLKRTYVKNYVRSDHRIFARQLRICRAAWLGF